MTNRPAPAGSSGQTRWAIIGLCAALIFAGGAVWWTQRGDATPSSPTTSSPMDEPSSAATASTIEPADGCLGGPNPERAVLVAHDTAPLTGDGAAAFLATYLRWHYLVPKVGGVDTITSRVWIDDLDEESAHLPSVEEIQEDGLRSYAVTFRDQHYRVNSLTGDVAQVDVTLTGLREGGGVTGRAVLPVLASVNRGRWVFAGIDWDRVSALGGSDNGRAARLEVAESGVPFQGGC